MLHGQSRGVDMVPTIRFTSEEVEDGVIGQDTLQKAKNLFNANGALLLENAFSSNFVRDLHACFISRYSAYFDDKVYPDARHVGDKRNMVTVELEHPFNTPDLYANPLVFPIIKQLLGRRCIVGSFGAVISLPGSEDQSIHGDHPRLFDDDGVGTATPSFAITLVVPLVELNETNGTTRMFKGSHLVPLEEAATMDHQDPVAPIGSCLLMDYRLLHGGTANRSDQVRPILYLVYHRPWFRDCVNFGKQSPLQMKDREYRRVPGAYRHLFSWARSGSTPEQLKYERNPAVSETTVDDEVFLVEPESEEIFYLDSVTSGLWRLLASPKTLAEAQAVFRDAFPDKDAATVERDVGVALEDMSARKLIVTAS